MAKYINTDLVKRHLLVDAAYTDDDYYIGTLMDVAEDSVSVHLDMPLASLAEANGGQLPASVIQAMLLMVGNLYANREPVTVGVSVAEMPLSYQYLIGLYMNHSIG